MRKQFCERNDSMQKMKNNGKEIKTIKQLRTIQKERTNKWKKQMKKTSERSNERIEKPMQRQ